MLSVNSFFNVALCRKHVKRFAPMWGLYTFLLLMIPFYIFLGMSQTSLTTGENLRSVRDFLYGLGAFGSYSVGVVLGLALAMAMWAYLYNHRAVSLIHALPMTRKTIFVTNYITGILFFLVPHLIVMAVTALVMLGGGVFDMGALLGCFGTLTLTVFTFYNFATLFALITGHLVVLPVIYIVFQFLAVAVIGLFRFLFEAFVYGYASVSGDFMDKIALWGTPIYAYADKLDTNYTYEVGTTGIDGFEVVLIYAAVSIVFAIAAYVVLSKRDVECSGEIITVSFLKPVFKYGFAVCVALFGGTLFYLMFSYTVLESVWGLLLFNLLWGIIGYYAASMIMKKSLRVFKGSLRPCLTMLVAISVLLCVMEFDLTGYEKSVPDPNTVISVELDGVTISDKDYIEAVTVLHEALVNEKAGVEAFDTEQDNDALYLELIGEPVDTDSVYPSFAQWEGWGVTGREWIDVTYTMENGDVLARSYYFPTSIALLERENSPAALYTAIKNNGDWREWRYIYPNTNILESEMMPTDLTVFLYEMDGNTAEYVEVKVQNFSAEERETLFAAMLEDLRAEQLGTYYPINLPEKYETNYENSIYFVFRTAYNEGEDALYADTGWYTTRDSYGEIGVSISLEAGSSATLTALETMGIPMELFVTKQDYDFLAYQSDYSYYYGEYYGESTVVVDTAVSAEAVEDYTVDASYFQNP